jgi:hypothetical protein
MKIQLGDRVKDSITGLTGIAVAKTQWLHGCERITIQPEKLNEGKVPDTATFDEPQVVVVKAQQSPKGRTDTGGPRPEPQRKATPTR